MGDAERRVSYPVLRASALRGAPVRVVVAGKAYALFRDGEGRAAAVDDRCPHRFAPLSAGRVRSDGRLACPYHGWNFDREGHGRSPSQPSMKGCDVRAYTVREACGYVWLAHDERAEGIDHSLTALGEATFDGSPVDAIERFAADPGKVGVTAGAHVSWTVAGARVTLTVDGARYLLALVPEAAGRTRVVAFGPVRGIFARLFGSSSSHGAITLPAAVCAAVADAFAPKAAEKDDGKVRLALAANDSWTGYRRFVVREAHDDGGDVRSFYLAPKDGAALPPYRAGQHLTFRLDVPGREKPLVRCYSLSDCHRATHYRVSIKRAPSGAGSGFFHEHVGAGAEVLVKAPAGHFALDPDAKSPVVLLAAGVGVTPLLAMLNAIIASGAPRDTWLYYGVRRAADIVQRAHIERIAKEHSRVRVRFFVSGEDLEPSDVMRRGRLDLEHVKREAPRDEADFYLCGPGAMMAEMTEALAAWGVPEARIHYEAFGPSTVKRTRAPTNRAAAEPLQVTFARSGITLAWDPSAASLLAFAKASGVDIDSGCCLGTCTTCKTSVVRGSVAWVGDPGEAPEEGTCLPCIAVPKTDVTLDA